MAGKGERFGDFIPKQLHNLSGKKIYLHTLDAFLKIPIIDEIILVCNKEMIRSIKQETSHPNVKIVEGGQTRQESSYKGLLACNPRTDIVTIHDGVRPFVSQKIILENIKMAKIYDAVDTCIDTFDTIVQTFESNFIKSIPDRKTLLRGQTPQTFNYNLILKAHNKALADNITNASDDCSLALRLGIKVYVVQGDEYNIKITNKLDLFIAEQLFRHKVISVEDKKGVSLKKKIFAVVGGTGGIGKEIVSLLEKEGSLAIGLSLSSKIHLDLTHPSSIKEAFKKIYRSYGKIDGLINAAGLLTLAPLKKLSLEEIQKLIQINFSGLILSCKEAKIKKEGHIINISSSSCFRGRKNFSLYSSCKAGVVNLTQALAEELPHMKINAVIPQRTNTPMRRKNFPNENLKLLLPPEDVAKTVIDLLKDQTLTGCLIEVKKE